MLKQSYTYTAWAIQWHVGILGRYFTTPAAGPLLPPHMEGCRHMLFKSKAECVAHIKARFSYIKTRPDLRGAPHFWRMPKPVKVKITMDLANG